MKATPSGQKDAVVGKFHFVLQVGEIENENMMEMLILRYF